MGIDYLSLIVVVIVAFVPATVILLKTNQSKKRGCGRGCAHCGNREFCHRKKLSVRK